MKTIQKIVVTLVMLFSFSGIGALAHAAMVNGQKVVVPYVTSVSGWWTGISIFNDHSYQRKFKFFCRAEPNESVATTFTTIDPYSMKTDALQGFVPDLVNREERVRLSIMTVTPYPFYVTVFMGNANTGGFSFLTYKSESARVSDSGFLP